MKNGLLKSSLVTLFIFLVIAAKSQSSLFVRVYDMNGNKMGNGKITNISDSSMQLAKSGHIYLVKNIGFIRTKHSFGHNVLISSAITGIACATLLSLGSNDGQGVIMSWTLSEGIGIGLLAGAVYGPFIGAFSTLFKNTVKFPINGSEKNWKEFYRYSNNYK